MSVRYEPFSSEFRDDPYPHYEALRDHAPLHFAEDAKAYCVSRYDDVRAVLLDAERFSSDAMRTLLLGAEPGQDPSTDPAAMQRMLTIAEALPFPVETLALARNLISLDPPLPMQIIAEMLASRASGATTSSTGRIGSSQAAPARDAGRIPSRAASCRRWRSSARTCRSSRPSGGAYRATI
jgi:hypothetical protein